MLYGMYLHAYMYTPEALIFSHNQYHHHNKTLILMGQLYNVCAYLVHKVQCWHNGTQDRYVIRVGSHSDRIVLVTFVVAFILASSVATLCTVIKKIITVEPLYSGHSWGTTLWPLYRGGSSPGVWLLWKSMYLSSFRTRVCGRYITYGCCSGVAVKKGSTVYIPPLASSDPRVLSIRPVQQCNTIT